MKFTNRTYDTLKYIQRIFLPAIAALYAALASLWGWGYGEQIVGTISAIDVCLGALLEVSSAAYKRSRSSRRIWRWTSNAESILFTVRSGRQYLRMGRYLRGRTDAGAGKSLLLGGNPVRHRSKIRYRRNESADSGIQPLGRKSARAAA